MTWLSTALQSFTRLFKWWVVVAPWEQGLRVRGGKRAKPLGAGIHFRIPFLDRLYFACTRRRVVQDASQTLTTSDGKVVTVSLAIAYSVDDFETLMSSVAMPERTLLNIMQGAVAEHVARTTSADLTPAGLELGVSGRLDDRVSGWGLGQLEAHVTGFAYVRTYRLIGESWSASTGMDEAFNGDDQRKAAAG